jgi:ectoine hydroxylase-related dioxygenase (phytanoyl-CoA dioxygenase family)
MTGLNHDIGAFDEHGYVVLDGLLGGAFAAELYAACDELPKITWNTARSTANERTLLQDERFRRIFTDTIFIDRLTAIVGDDLQMLDLQLLEFAPNATHVGAVATGTREWHTDVTFFSDRPLAVNVAMYLTDMTPDKGPLYVIPGSHRWHREPTEAEMIAPHGDEVVVEVPAGTAIAFDAQLWHTGSKNLSATPRRGLFAYCSHYWVKRMDEYYARPLPDAILHSDDARMRQLFGLDTNAVSIHGAAYAPGNETFM